MTWFCPIVPRFRWRRLRRYRRYRFLRYRYRRYRYRYRRRLRFRLCLWRFLSFFLPVNKQKMYFSPLFRDE